MIVRAMDIDQPITDLLEQSQSDGSGVEKLTVGAGGAEGTFDDQLTVLAWFYAMFGKELVEGGRHTRDIEEAFDGAGLRIGTDEGTIGPLTEKEIEGAEHDRFPGTGFAGEDDQTFRELKGEFLDQCKVSDVQPGQHEFGNTPILLFAIVGKKRGCQWFCVWGEEVSG